MSAVGDTRGMLVCTRSDPPVRPSRWCRWFGHADVVSTGRRGGRIEYRWYECERCGRDERWRDLRDFRTPDMLIRAGLTEARVAEIRGRA